MRVDAAWRVQRAHAPRRRSSSAFAAARIDRLTEDFQSPLVINDEILRSELPRIRRRSRQLARNNPWVRQYLKMMSVNVIGPTGIKHRARVRNAAGDLDQALNAQLQDAWLDFAENPVTIDGRLNLVQLEQMLWRQAPRDGEVLVRQWLGFRDNPHGLALQPLDVELLDETLNRPRTTRQTEIRLGVEVNEHGRPLTYYVWNALPGSPVQREYVAVPAAEMIHFMDHEYASQTRGVPWIASVMIALHMIGAYSETELVAARAGSAKMGFLQSVKEALAGEEDLDEPDADDELSMDAEPGSIEKLPPGYEFKAWDVDHPNAGYDQFIKSQLRQVASGLGVGYPTLANDLENINLSSIRHGLEIERDFYREQQQAWIASFRRRVYDSWLRMASLSGTIRLPGGDWKRARAALWQPRGWGFIDPQKDVGASIEAIEYGLTSRHRVLARNAEDPDEIFEELARENELATKLELKIDGPADQVEPDQNAPADEESPRAKAA
jgi:lambda family phage portal protein